MSLQDAQQCLELLRAEAARAGLLSPSRHPHWPKACQRLGDALLGLGQHRQVGATAQHSCQVMCKHTGDVIPAATTALTQSMPAAGGCFVGAGAAQAGGWCDFYMCTLTTKRS